MRARARDLSFPQNLRDCLERIPTATKESNAKKKNMLSIAKSYCSLIGLRENAFGRIPLAIIRVIREKIYLRYNYRRSTSDNLSFLFAKLRL